MGSTASVNNMGDPSLQGAGAHTLVHHPAVSPDSNKKLMCQNSHPTPSQHTAHASLKVGNLLSSRLCLKAYLQTHVWF